MKFFVFYEFIVIYVHNIINVKLHLRSKGKVHHFSRGCEKCKCLNINSFSYVGTSRLSIKLDDKNFFSVLHIEHMEQSTHSNTKREKEVVSRKASSLHL